MARSNVAKLDLVFGQFKKLNIATTVNTVDGAEILWNANDEQLLIVAENVYDDDRTDTFAGDGTTDKFQLSASAVDAMTSIKVDGSPIATDTITDTYDGDGENKFFQLKNIPVTSVTSVTVDSSPVSSPAGYSIDLTSGVVTLVAAPTENTGNVVIVYVGPKAVTDKAASTVTFEVAPEDKKPIEVKYVATADRVQTLTVKKGDSAQAVTEDFSVEIPQGETWVGQLESGKFLQCYNTAGDTAKKGKVLIDPAEIKMVCIKM